MDFFLTLYILIFLAILAFPFVFIAYKYKHESISSPFGIAEDEKLTNLKEEREILLSNLGDLKAEQETGKMKQGEFREYSKDILVSLQSIDAKINEFGDQPHPGSNKEVSRAEAVIKFCPECGTKALENAKFCHNCGTKF